MRLKQDTTLAGRLHASKTHKPGNDPACPVCVKAAATDLVKCSLDAILAAYPTDQTAPSLTLSKLPTGEYYASVCVYRGWDHSSGKAQPSRRTVFNAKGPSWDAAVRDAMGQFLNTQEVFVRLRAAL